MSTELGADELRRYARHLVLPEVGLEGQRRLKQAAVLVVGAGGLGSPLALYLAAAGIGRIGLVEFDAVDEANLQRQVLYGTADLGRAKIEVARQRLRDLNPHVHVELYPERLTADNARAIVAAHDVVADATDNFPTRYLVNDACVLAGKPDVWAAIFRFEGQVSVFWRGHGPCYRCLYPEPPAAGLVPDCAEGGVLGVLPGVIGCLQTTEVVKLILERGAPLTGRLLLFDALALRFRELTLRRDPDCPICGERPTIRRLTDVEDACATVPAAGDGAVGVVELRRRLQAKEPPLLLDVREPVEWAICRLEGAVHVPLGELPRRLDELDPRREIVVYCKTDVRSARAVEWLRERGFDRVRWLRGGIDAWSSEVDPRMPRY